MVVDIEVVSLKNNVVSHIFSFYFFQPFAAMQGVPLLGTLQRARKKYRESMGDITLPATRRGTKLCSTSPMGLRVIMIERGEPDYERLLALFTQMMNDVDTAITELKSELKRMAGGVVDADHTVLNIRDYRDVYSLQPRVIMEQLHKNKKRHIDLNQDNGTDSDCESSLSEN